MANKLIIGYQTENNANNLSIDISVLKTRFPSATPQLWAVRPGETKINAYPVPKQSVSGNTLIWTPLAVDVEKNGDGEAQVRMYDTSGAEIIEARSEIIPTVIQRSIIPGDGEGDLPAVVQSYAAMLAEVMGDEIGEIAKEVFAEMMPATDEGEKTLTNSQEFPFNNSKSTIALTTPLVNTNYIVLTEVVDSDGNVGEIVVSDKMTNGFALAFTGSATQVEVEYAVIGGLTE